MEVYIYQADLWCEDCGKAIKRECRKTGDRPENWRDETTFDSDQYPKGPYSDGGGESDCPEHCAAGDDCLNAIILSDGTKIGAWLENDLTPYGVAYVKDAIREGGEVSELWREFYRDYDLEDSDDEDN